MSHQLPLSLTNHGPCAVCGEPVFKYYACFTCQYQGKPHQVHIDDNRNCADKHVCGKEP